MQVQLEWSLTDYSDFIAAEQLLHTYRAFDYFYFIVIACMGKHFIMTHSHRDCLNSFNVNWLLLNVYFK